MGKMRGVLEEKNPFVEGSPYYLQLPEVQIRNCLLQIACSTMDKLGGGAGRGGCEITGVNQRGLKASKLRIQGTTGARRPRPDHANIDPTPADLPKRLGARLHFTGRLLRRYRRRRDMPESRGKVGRFKP